MRLFPREQKWYLSRVTSSINCGFDHLWGWATWRDRWERIKPWFLLYYRHIENVDYRDRPLADILAEYRRHQCTSVAFVKDRGCQDFAFYFGMAKAACFR